MSVTREELESVLDSKLEPIINSLSAIKTDVEGVRTHVNAINERLYKLEARMANVDGKIDKLLRITEELSKVPA